MSGRRGWRIRRNDHMKLILQTLLTLLLLVGLAGCKHIGPKTIVDSRVPYNEAILNSWKQQALLNVVRLRYADIPEFVDVPSVVNGYERGQTGTLGVSTEFFPNNFTGSPITPDIGTTQTLIDRPTITYAPQTGSEFTRNLTTPIPPVVILNLIESGYAADVILELTVESINGIRNRGFTGNPQPADPEFQQVLTIMRKAQAAGHVSLRVLTGTDKNAADVVLSIRSDNLPEEAAAELYELRRMLRLDPSLNEFKVVFGTLPRDKNEIAFRTRSVYRILAFLALDVQAPECHLADGRAPDLGDNTTLSEPHFTVYSGCEMPKDCFAAVQYQGYWFWIDQRDFNSKRTMIFLKILLAMADTRTKEGAPVLTIRAN